MPKVYHYMYALSSTYIFSYSLEPRLFLRHAYVREGYRKRYSRKIGLDMHCIVCYAVSVEGERFAETHTKGVDRWARQSRLSKTFARNAWTRT